MVARLPRSAVRTMLARSRCASLMVYVFLTKKGILSTQALVKQSPQRLSGDITAKLRAVEPDLFHRRVSRRLRRAQILRPRRHAEHAAAIGDDRVAIFR